MRPLPHAYEEEKNRQQRCCSPKSLMPACILSTVGIHVRPGVLGGVSSSLLPAGFTPGVGWTRLARRRALLLGAAMCSRHCPAEEALHEWSHLLSLSGTQRFHLQDRSGWTRPPLGVLSLSARLSTNHRCRSHCAQKLPN